MRVPVERYAGVGVPEACLDGLHVHSATEQKGRLRVAQLVEPQPLEAVAVAERPPPTLEVAYVDEASRGRAANGRLGRLADAELRKLRRLPGSRIVLADCGMSADAKALARYLAEREENVILAEGNTFPTE